MAPVGLERKVEPALAPSIEVLRELRGGFPFGDAGGGVVMEGGECKENGEGGRGLVAWFCSPRGMAGTWGRGVGRGDWISALAWKEARGRL